MENNDYMPPKLDDFELDNLRHLQDCEVDNEFYENELITEEALYYSYDY